MHRPIFYRLHSMHRRSDFRIGYEPMTTTTTTGVLLPAVAAASTVIAVFVRYQAPVCCSLGRSTFTPPPSPGGRSSDSGDTCRPICMGRQLQSTRRLYCMAPCVPTCHSCCYPSSLPFHAAGASSANMISERNTACRVV